MVLEKYSGDFFLILISIHGSNNICILLLNASVAYLCSYFFSRGYNLGCPNETYVTDRRSHLYNFRSNIVDSRLWTRTKCYLTRVIQIDLSRFG